MSRFRGLFKMPLHKATICILLLVTACSKQEATNSNNDLEAKKSDLITNAWNSENMAAKLPEALAGQAMVFIGHHIEKRCNFFSGSEKTWFNDAIIASSQLVQRALYQKNPSPEYYNVIFNNLKNEMRLFAGVHYPECNEAAKATVMHSQVVADCVINYLVGTKNKSCLLEPGKEQVPTIQPDSLQNPAP